MVCRIGCLVAGEVTGFLSHEPQTRVRRAVQSGDCIEEERMTAWGQLASERVLRSLMKSIAERLKPGNKLSAKQVMTLLREQARLADTLREVVSARQAKREAQERERARNIQIANTPTEAKNSASN